MKKEVEILWELVDSKARAIRALHEFASHGTKRTKDVYFYDPLRSALQPTNGRLKGCFRIRQKDNQTFLTYKIDHFQGGEWLYSDEHETSVGDFQVAQDILRALGFKKLVEVDMKKSIFFSEDFEVVIEEVKGLGKFIEIESQRSVQEKNVEKEKMRIRQFLQSLDIRVGQELNSGKPELLLKKRGW